jgi:hypothetical protein
VTSERTQAIILRMSIISDIAQRVVRLPLHPGTQPGLQRAMSGAQWARWEARRVPNGQDTRLRVCHGNQHGDELGGYRHPLGSGGRALETWLRLGTCSHLTMPERPSMGQVLVIFFGWPV